MPSSHLPDRRVKLLVARMRVRDRRDRVRMPREPLGQGEVLRGPVDVRDRPVPESVEVVDALESGDSLPVNEDHLHSPGARLTDNRHPASLDGTPRAQSDEIDPSMGNGAGIAGAVPHQARNGLRLGSQKAPSSARGADEACCPRGVVHGEFPALMVPTSLKGAMGRMEADRVAAHQMDAASVSALASPVQSSTLRRGSARRSNVARRSNAARL